MNWKDISKVPLKNEVFLHKEEIRASIMEKCYGVNRSRGISAVFRKILVAACVLSFVLPLTFMLSNVKIQTAEISKNVSLPDGSKVLLNQNSEVRYNKIAWLFRRTIHLDGAALFEVTKGSPFSVATSMARIEVLGTIFDVDATIPDHLFVFCKEGSVRVVSPTVEQVLSQGDAIELKGEKSRYKPKLEEFYEFESIKLADLAEQLSSYFGVVFVIEPGLKNQTYSGFVPTANIEDALDILTNTCDITYQIKADTVYLKK